MHKFTKVSIVLNVNKKLAVATARWLPYVSELVLLARYTLTVIGSFIDFTLSQLRGFYCTSARGWTTCFTTEVSARRTGFDRLESVWVLFACFVCVLVYFDLFCVVIGRQFCFYRFGGFALMPAVILGSYCQVNVDDCQPNPCRNGGVCIDRINSFYCNCTEDWMGVVCEKPYDVCELLPCQVSA